MRKYFVAIILVIIVISGGLVYFYQIRTDGVVVDKTGGENSAASLVLEEQTVAEQTAENPLDINFMRREDYPGSDLVIEEKLAPGSNFDQYVASYKSEGLKIYGLLAVPKGAKPDNGWPVIIFNHGYIQPDLYKTTERYLSYVAALAKSGYVVFKPDFRGHGNSEGAPSGPYYSPGYTIDVLNAIASLKKYKDVNSEKIGIWGHSMGGNIALRSIVVNTKDIKAAVIWGGVVGSYDDLINNWQSKVKFRPPARDLFLRNNHRQQFIDEHGMPVENPDFWNAMDPTYFLADVTAPVQLHTGGDDEEVPVAFSAGLKDKLIKAGKTVEYYNYPGGDHNIASPNFEPAMRITIEFFDKYLK